MSRDFIIYPAVLGMLAISIPMFRADETVKDSTINSESQVAVKSPISTDTFAKQEPIEASTQSIAELSTRKQITLTSVSADRTPEPVVEMIQRDSTADQSSKKSTLFGRLCAAVRTQNDDDSDSLQLSDRIDDLESAAEHGDHQHDGHDHGDHDHGDHDHGDHDHGDHANDDDHSHGDHAHNGDHNHAHSHSHDHVHDTGQVYGDSVMAPMAAAPLAWSPMETAPMNWAPMDTAPLAPVESYGVELATPMAYSAPVYSAPTYLAPELPCAPAIQPISIAPIAYAPIAVAPITYAPMVVQHFRVVPAPVTYSYQTFYRKKSCGLLSGLHRHLRNLFARHRANKRARWGGCGCF